MEEAQTKIHAMVLTNFISCFADGRDRVGYHFNRPIAPDRSL